MRHVISTPGALRQLEELALDRNRLVSCRDGALPRELAALSRLRYLYLARATGLAVTRTVANASSLSASLSGTSTSRTTASRAGSRTRSVYTRAAPRWALVHETVEEAIEEAIRQRRWNGTKAPRVPPEFELNSQSRLSETTRKATGAVHERTRQT